MPMLSLSVLYHSLGSLEHIVTLHVRVHMRMRAHAHVRA